MKRTFIHTGKAWYAKSSLADQNHFDEIFINVEDDSGADLGGFAIEFHNLNTECARISCFDDATRSLVACSDLIEEMSKSEGFSVKGILALLKAFGFEDRTPLSINPPQPEKLDYLRVQLRSMIENLASKVEWDQIDGELMNIGLFVNHDQFFVAPIGVGTPDTVTDHMMTGARAFGFSTIKQSDDPADVGETIDMLLVNAKALLQALTPNETTTD